MIRPEAALHVIDEGPQLRHDLTATGIIKEYAGQPRRERLQHARQSSHLYRRERDRLRHLHKANAVDRGAKKGWKSLAISDPVTITSTDLLPSTKGHGSIAPFGRAAKDRRFC